MPSPFPGMDPYLESRWQGVHSQLVPEIARQLSPKLLPRYYAETTERFVFVEPEDVAISVLYPDVSVASADAAADPGTAAATLAAPLELTTVIPEGVPQVSLEIRDARHRQLVTAIELLSPTNKRGDGHREYLEKRRRILTSSAHLLEIDLLRTGRRPPMLDTLPAASYFIFLARAERRPRTEVWPIGLRDRLPIVPVPLLPGDADVTLDVQAAFDAVYDILGYRYSTDYEGPPDGDIAEADADFIEARLQAAGLR